MVVLLRDLLGHTPGLISTRCIPIASVPAALPGLADAAPGAGAAMTELLRGAPDTDAPLAQDCLRLLAALLRACSTYRSAARAHFRLACWSLHETAPVLPGLVRSVASLP